MKHGVQVFGLLLSSTLAACTLPDPEARTSGESPAAGATIPERSSSNVAPSKAPSSAPANQAAPSAPSEPTGGAGGSKESQVEPNAEAIVEPSIEPNVQPNVQPNNESNSEPNVEPNRESTDSVVADSNVVETNVETNVADAQQELVAPEEPSAPVPPPPPSSWYDFTTGLGFASKGDVQSAFGWNDEGLTGAVCSSVLGSNHDCGAFFVPQSLHVWFTLEARDVYRATCMFETGPEDMVHEITIPRHVYIDSSLTSVARPNGAKAITGFNLAGPTYTTLGAKIPVVGEPCVGANGNAQNGTWSSVELVESNGGIGLWVHTDLAARASDVQLWQK